MTRLVLALVLLAAGTAHAQLNIDPGAPPPEAPPTTETPLPLPGAPIPPEYRPGAGPQVIQVQPQPAGDQEKPPEGIYFDSTSGARRPEDDGVRHEGAVPEEHVVVAGDTLWDLCNYYYGDPWRWPEVWSYNPAITNPHWIYPGNLIRLRPPGGATAATQPADTAETPEDTSPLVNVEAPRERTNRVNLRQLAFASTGEMKEAGTVKGSTEERELLAEGMDIYIDYSAGRPPQVGRRYAIYSPNRKLENPKDKKVVGAYVIIRGEVLILEVKKGKTARGRITYSTNTDPIERGNRVGPLKTQFKEVTPVTAPKDLDATVVGQIGTDYIVGEDQIVFLDRGKQQGLKPGHRLFVVRRGDAYDVDYGPYDPAGRNDTRFPDHAVAEIVVVDTGPTTAIAVVTLSRQEIMPGDRALAGGARRSSK